MANRYNAAAVDAAISSSNRAGRRISGREARAIHSLLSGREPQPRAQVEAFAAIQRHGAHQRRRFAAHCEALRNRLARLHPETGGNPGLVHNWGNEAAKATLARSNARSSAWLAYMNGRYSAMARAYGRGDF